MLWFMLFSFTSVLSYVFLHIASIIFHYLMMQATFWQMMCTRSNEFVLDILEASTCHGGAPHPLPHGAPPACPPLPPPLLLPVSIKQLLAM
jgi:hypothetical protein